jgi:hypothetical protein
MKAAGSLESLDRLDQGSLDAGDVDYDSGRRLPGPIRVEFDDGGRRG